MNYSIIIYILGWIMNVEAVCMLVPGITALIYREKSGIAFLITILACLAIGVPLVSRKPSKKAFYSREGLVTTALSWIVLSIVGAVPFVLSGAIPNPIDAFFEIVSGFTTTGSSILSDPSQMPYSINIWRCFSHWIGGMGVLVFILSLLPLTGGYHMNLMKAESPGPSVSRLVPKVRLTAKLLYSIYIFMTVVEILFLLAGKMPLFDAVTVTFGTAGTGGFAIKNNSIAGYSPYIQNVVTVFMILFGVNFNVYFLILMKRVGQAFRTEELRWYLIIIAVSIGIITVNTAGLYRSLGDALHHASFQVASIITTTGFATQDFDLWPQASKTILVLLMFIGACAGSTGGGVKVSRLVVLVKTVRKELIQFLHPQVIRKIKMDGKVVEHEVVRSINVFMVAYTLLFSLSVFLLAFDGEDLITNFTAVAATFNNIGPGLELVGPSKNFGIFSEPAKLVLIFDMLAGRLEIFPVLILFSRETWKKF